MVGIDRRHARVRAHGHDDGVHTRLRIERLEIGRHAAHADDHRVDGQGGHATRGVLQREGRLLIHLHHRHRASLGACRRQDAVKHGEVAHLRDIVCAQAHRAIAPPSQRPARVVGPEPQLSHRLKNHRPSLLAHVRCPIHHAGYGLLGDPGGGGDIGHGDVAPRALRGAKGHFPIDHQISSHQRAPPFSVESFDRSRREIDQMGYVACFFIYEYVNIVFGALMRLFRAHPPKTASFVLQGGRHDRSRTVRHPTHRGGRARLHATSGGSLRIDHGFRSDHLVRPCSRCLGIHRGHCPRIWLHRRLSRQSRLLWGDHRAHREPHRPCRGPFG